MPRYGKSQLDGFVADRRYWDQKHPEHQAHLDFTVKAFEAAYPDPVAPTPEQEEWAAAEEKRLREMGKLRPFWDRRDPGHAAARAEFYRGFDKINAVLYGTQDPDGDAPAPVERPMRAARDPLDPTAPAPDGFARAARATQMAQAAQAAPAPPAQFPSPAQIHRNETIGDRPAPSAGNPNRTVWQAESDDAARAAEAARQRAIQQERSLPESQRQLTNRAPEDWDRERPMPPMTNPIPGARIRARDPQGGGHFGAGRGNRPHFGVDIEAAPGTEVVAPVSGIIRQIDLEPYGDPKYRGRYTGIVIETDDGDLARVLYVSPTQSLAQGQRVERGQTRIGQAQDLHQTHDRSMTNHVHVDFQRAYPAPPAGGGRSPQPNPTRMFVDPTPYIRRR
ncbi:MAG: M23 family metallopeptidase [Tagaea sp.]